MTDTPTPADLAAFGASEAACYLYPGADQQPLRAAYCAGAASMVPTCTPLNLHKTGNRGIEMSDADTLQRLGDDASKWAAEFRQTAIKLGYSDMDEGWLLGWFANAIEHSTDVRRLRDRAIALAEKSDV